MLYNYEDILFTVESILKLEIKNLSQENLFFIERMNVIKRDIKLNYLLSEIYLYKGAFLRDYERATSILDYSENLRNNISVNKEF